MTWVVIHPECGFPAFYLTEYPALGAARESRCVVFPDGSKPEAFARIECFYCKEIFMPTRKMIVPMPIIPVDDRAESVNDPDGS